MFNNTGEAQTGKRPVKSLLVKFFIYYLAFLSVNILFNEIVWEESKPRTYYIFQSMTNAAFFTILFNWNQFKSVFKSRKDS